jgi:hypothetical protein
MTVAKLAISFNLSSLIYCFSDYEISIMDYSNLYNLKLDNLIAYSSTDTTFSCLMSAAKLVQNE